MKTSRAGTIALGVILAISLFLHLYRLSYPARPVFDEAHFATYAADYIKGQVFFDIHPPLGKLIYAAVIPLAHPAPLCNTDFVSFTHSPTGTVYFATNIPYGSFPYVALRLVSVFFGLALIAAFYFFLRSIGVSEAGALLGAFFAAFENALLLETKLILMNGMYLTFGFAALAAWFGTWPRGQGQRAILAGFLFALSLGVKLTGIVFLGPVVASVIPGARKIFSTDPATRRPRGDIKKFLATAIFVFISISFLNFLFFSPHDILAFAQSMGLKLPVPHNARATDLLAYAATTILPWTGYLIGGAQIQGSPWYFWPFMRGAMNYYLAPANVGNLVLTGNPIIWYGSTLAVLIGIILLIRRLIRKSPAPYAPLSILLAGYLFSLLPYFTFVQRGTFLYHYFPALLFGIGLLAYLLSKSLKWNAITELSPRQWLLAGIIAAVVLSGFFLTAPLTYGL